MENIEGTMAAVPSLYQRYQKHFSIGAAVSPGALDTHRSLLIHHYNTLTCENHMKPSLIHPEEEVYTFDTADRIVDFAMDHRMRMRGHTLVWHQQTPEWFFTDRSGSPTTPDRLLGILKDHIETVMGRYKGRISSWDVVNEAVEDKKGIQLRQTKWLEVLGDDYLYKAFELAANAACGAALFYNDYNAVNPEKRDKIIRLVKDLLGKGAPIDGIGLQGHWNIHDINLNEIRKSIELYASLGLKLQITELDLSVYHWDEDGKGLLQPTSEMMALQAEKYEDIFRLFREYSDVITGVTFWGAADDVTWLDNFPVRGRKNWPLLFDIHQNPKDSLWRIIDFKQ